MKRELFEKTPYLNFSSPTPRSSTHPEKKKKSTIKKAKEVLEKVTPKKKPKVEKKEKEKGKEKEKKEKKAKKEENESSKEKKEKPKKKS